MALYIQVPKGRFQFLLRTSLLLFIPVALLTGCSPPIDVEVTVEQFYWYKSDIPEMRGRVGLGAKVRITNRSSNTVWYMENPRYCLIETVDKRWLTSSSGASPPRTPGKAEQDWWLPQNGMESRTIDVGPISEKATAIRIVVPFTTDKFMPKRHWVSGPEVKIVKRGKDYFPEVEKGAHCTQSLAAPTLISEDMEK